VLEAERILIGIDALLIEQRSARTLEDLVHAALRALCDRGYFCRARLIERMEHERPGLLISRAPHCAVEALHECDRAGVRLLDTPKSELPFGAQAQRPNERVRKGTEHLRAEYAVVAEHVGRFR